MVSKMGNRKHVCNYAVLHFQPYPETGEFVCVGVVLLCQENNYLNYKLETKKRDRITAFFPEMKSIIFTKGRTAFEEYLRATIHFANEQLPFQEKKQSLLFRELTRDRESLFRFSSIGTVLTEDPAQELERLYKSVLKKHL